MGETALIIIANVNAVKSTISILTGGFISITIIAANAAVCSGERNEKYSIPNENEVFTAKPSIAPDIIIERIPRPREYHVKKAAAGEINVINAHVSA